MPLLTHEIISFYEDFFIHHDNPRLSYDDMDSLLDKANLLMAKTLIEWVGFADKRTLQGTAFTLTVLNPPHESIYKTPRISIKHSYTNDGEEAEHITFLTS